jgi:hypothetical protein
MHDSEPENLRLRALPPGPREREGLGGSYVMELEYQDWARLRLGVRLSQRLGGCHWQVQLEGRGPARGATYYGRAQRSAAY